MTRIKEQNLPCQGPACQLHKGHIYLGESQCACQDLSNLSYLFQSFCQNTLRCPQSSLGKILPVQAYVREIGILCPNSLSLSFSILKLEHLSPNGKLKGRFMHPFLIKIMGNYFSKFSTPSSLWNQSISLHIYLSHNLIILSKQNAFRFYRIYVYDP